MLQQYGPALIIQCQNVIELSGRLVKTWLERWMFKADEERVAKARLVAERLNAHNEHLVHMGAF